MSRAAAELREKHLRFPSAVEALFLVIALFAVQYVVAAALRDMRGLVGIDVRDIGPVVTLLGNGVLFTFLLYYKRMTYASLFHASRSSVGATLGLLAVPILLTVPAMALLLPALVTVIEWFFPLARWEEVMFERMMSSPLAAVISGCILAPLLEEMLFRGILLRSFLLQYTRGRAFLYSALIFGLAHLNIYQFAVAFLAGLLLAWLYERTRSLWPCILLHAAYNSVITWQWFGAQGPAEEPASTQALFLYWLFALGLAFAGFAMMRRLLTAQR